MGHLLNGERPVPSLHRFLVGRSRVFNTFLAVGLTPEAVVARLDLLFPEVIRPTFP